MSVKDKIIFGLIIVLLIGGGYIQYTYMQLVDVMDVLASQDLYSKATIEKPIIDTHVDQVNTDFDQRLETLRLEFIGRAKHVRANKLGVEANTALIDKNTDSLATMISDVQFNLDEFKRDTEKNLDDLERDIAEQQDAFDSYRRRLTRQISDIEQSVATIQNDINKLNTKVFEEDNKKK